MCVGVRERDCVHVCVCVSPPLLSPPCSDNLSYSQSLSLLQVFDPVEVLMSHTMEGRVLHNKVKHASGGGRGKEDMCMMPMLHTPWLCV